MRLWKHVTVLTALAIVAVGCAALGGRSDADLVCDVMTQWETATNAGDVDAVMELYSVDYEDRRGSTREEMRERLEQWLPRMAEREESIINTTEALPTVEGDTATFGPVMYQFGERSFGMQFKLAKEADGVWRIVGTERAETDE